MKGKTVKPVYTKLTQLEHILKRPDTYVGSNRLKTISEYVAPNDSFKIEQKSIQVIPGLLRIFIEPLSNIIDNVARSKQSNTKVSKIEITVNKETGLTTLWNDGEVIPIELHPDEKCYNHTMIFGHLLTSSNYDDTQDREDISGKNGLGVKLTSVFSKEFTVSGADNLNQKSFSQTWKNNMRDVSEPVIKPYKLGKGYTKVSYVPDFSQFGIPSYTDDIISLYKKYAIDTAMLTKIPVFFNGVEIPVNSLLEYAKLYMSEDDSDRKTLFMKSTDSEVVLTEADSFSAISFANGVHTSQGGVHVDMWCEAIFRPIVDKVNGSKKPALNISDVKNFFRIFVVSSVKQPVFDSQSKLRLESPSVSPLVKKTNIATICTWNSYEYILDLIKAKEMSVLKKLERKAKKYEKIDGLESANFEGVEGKDCNLILVEGLSAKTYVVDGISTGLFGKIGRDYNGVYALKGKLLNTRNAKPVTIAANKVVEAIIKCLNLKQDMDYTNDENFKTLRYSRLVIVTDADVDGIHICGLIQNLFHSLYPSLLARTPSFLTSMQTPIVRVYLSKTKQLLFYDEEEYRKYVKSMGGKKIEKKYYKGLASSSSADIQDTFGRKLIEYKLDDKANEAMNKAFHTKFADTRKKWLADYVPGSSVINWNANIPEVKPLAISDFIDGELIKFSIDDCKRSIPNLVDGLKEGHRKVLYGAFLKKLKYDGKELKVAQFGNYVAEKTAYHHGENNLCLTVVSMAQGFVGSNNIPLLDRCGGFGSRKSGGVDAGNPRYLNTKLDKLTRLLFPEEDEPLLEYNEDDGDVVEPKNYIPIIPMVLVNGVIGIGTGWSCNVPCFNPKDLIECIRVWIASDGDIFDEEGVCSLPELIPWYRGFTGRIEKEEEGKYITWGTLKRGEGRNKNKVYVSELPINYWTDDFQSDLDSAKENKNISSYSNNSKPNTIDFTITELKDGMTLNENNLKLFTYLRTSNMVLFNEENRLEKFPTVYHIIDRYCRIRVDMYEKRRQYWISKLEKSIKLLENKKRFLEEVRDGKITLFVKKGNSKSKSELITELTELKYDKVNADEENKEEDEEEDKTKSGYEYLLRLQISSITAEKILKLKSELATSIKTRDEYKNMNAQKMWLKELDAFVPKYEAYIKDYSN